MDERGWLFFALFTFFTFVGISYVRESKLVFLVEKYSSQLESLQNVSIMTEGMSSNEVSQVMRSPGKPVNERGRSEHRQYNDGVCISIFIYLVKIYKIPVSSKGVMETSIPDITNMRSGNYEAKVIMDQNSNYGSEGSDDYGMEDSDQSGNYGSEGSDEYRMEGSEDYGEPNDEYVFNDKEYGKFDDLKNIEQGDDSTTTSPFPARMVQGYPNPEDNTNVDAFLINESKGYTHQPNVLYIFIKILRSRVLIQTSFYSSK